MTFSNSDGPIQHQEVIKLVRQRAEILFNNNKLCCSEALPLVLNHGFKGVFSSEQAKQLGAGFCGDICTVISRHCLNLDVCDNDITNFGVDIY